MGFSKVSTVLGGAHTVSLVPFRVEWESTHGVNVC